MNAIHTPHDRRTFYTLTVTQALSLIGSRMTGFAVGLWVFTETGDVTPVLLTSFFLELPGMLGASLAGVLADRWDRRHVIMLGDAGEALGTSLLLVSFLSGHFQLWHLYAAALVKGTFMTLQGPAADAAITMLVPDADRERANAIKEMAFPLAGIIAPALGGLLFTLIGVTGIIALDLMTFVIAVVVVYLIHIPRPAQTDEGRLAAGGLWREWLGGLRFLVRRPALVGLVLYVALAFFLLNGPLELTIPYVVTITGSEALVGLLLGVMSAGALGGALAIAAWGGSRPRIHTLLPAYAFSGLMMVVYGVVRSPLLLGVALFAVMFPLPATNALLKSILQAKTPPDLQGRVFGVVFQLIFLAPPLSFLLTGPLVNRLITPAVGGAWWGLVESLVGSGPEAAMGLVVVGAGVLLTASSAFIYALPSIRRLEADLPDYEVAAAPH